MVFKSRKTILAQEQLVVRKIALKRRCFLTIRGGRFRKNKSKGEMKKKNKMGSRRRTTGLYRAMQYHCLEQQGWNQMRLSSPVA